MHFLSFHRNIHYWFYNQKIALLLKLEKFLIYILENTESKVKKKKKKKVEKASWQATELQRSDMTEAI